MRYRNIISALFLLAFCAWYAYMTTTIPARSLPNTPGPSFFPWVITVLLAILSVSLLLKGIFGRGGTDLMALSGRPLKLAALFILAFLVYLVVLPWAGFTLASIPFFFVLMLIFGQRNPVWLVGISVALPVLVMLLFQKVFQVQLPDGALLSVIG